MCPFRSVAPAVIWFTGLSGAGKTTLALAVQERLTVRGVATELLDGDAVRLLSPAGFTRSERQVHIRRVGYLASRLEYHGVTVLSALISPYAETRQWVRQLCRRFIEVHVSTPLAECERRDVKGLYASARRGDLQNFTGIDDPYEPPARPELRVDTSQTSLDDAVSLILQCWKEHAWAPLVREDVPSRV